MPRNRNKTPCQVPACHNWAMRGHTHCRSHRDRELGPRGGGAPRGNLNAVKTGDNAHPLPFSDLQDLARQVASQPDQLPTILDLLVRSIHSRVHDPYRTLVACQATLLDFRQLVAAALFQTEVRVLLRSLTQPRQGPLLRSLNRQFRNHQTPEVALLSLRQQIAALEKKTAKQVPVQALLDPQPLFGYNACTA